VYEDWQAENGIVYYTSSMAISLGCHDPGLGFAEIDTFLSEVRRVSGEDTGKLRGDKGMVGLRPIEGRVLLSVSDVQQALTDAGFLPGGRADGICGYRTQAATRLFQEYVRSVEGRPCTPDGIVGRETATELQRWMDDGKKADWVPRLKQWEQGTLENEPCEFNDWLAFLRKWQEHCKANPSPMLKMVEAFQQQTDTHKVEDWKFTDQDVHLIGIRHGEQDRSRRFDDVLVLLIKGLVFKFQGSTDPGHTKHPDGAPFLVQGQHDFHFGLHQGRYHALRPLHHGTHGVLVVRSKGDFELTDQDLARGVDTNGTINIHWGGKGVGRAVNRWSEGCQVVTGSGYQNHLGKVVNCSEYVGLNNTEVSDPEKNKTRGSYNVLADLVVALSSDMRNPGLVKYTLLHATDVTIDAAITGIVSETRSAARQLMKKLA